MAITDARGRIIYANENFAEISGYSVEELIGEDHRLLNSGHHPKSFWTEMYRQVASGRVWRAEVCNRTKSGDEYWVDTTISAVRDETGAINQFVALRVDITNRKAAERALRTTKDELEVALRAADELNAELRDNYEKLFEAKAMAESAARTRSEFLANMSHEIRTPMTAIVGFADLLAGDDAGDITREQQLLYLRTIRQQGEHLLNLINDILDLAKVESGKLSTERIEVAPRAIAEEIADLLSHRSRAKGVELRCIVDDRVPETIQSDPTRLRQILTNLVGNAIKFTDRGEIEIQLRRGGPADPQAIEFVVSDTGIGMDRETLSRLFRPFEQADASTTRRFGGTGLGLRISKQLATALGGDILVESEPGVGSTFTVRLPMDAAPERVQSSDGGAKFCARPLLAPDGPQGEAEPPLRGIRVLLAEDGDDNALLLTHYLSKAGAQVARVVNGLEAVRAIYAEPTEDAGECSPDVIIMDMQMPVMDGYTAASVLRERGCTAPIIAATAHALEEDRRKCLEAGCTDYISKPIDRSRLVSVIQHAVRSAQRDAA